MQIFRATDRGPLKLEGFFDPHTVDVLESYWGAPPFEANKVYYQGDIFAPTVNNGFFYECIRNGKSGVEPTYSSPNTTVGTAIFKEMPWDLWLLPGQSVITSTWFVASATHLVNGLPVVVAPEASGVTLANETNNGVVTSVVVSLTLTNVLNFVVTNRAVKIGGLSEDRSYKLTVRNQ